MLASYRTEGDLNSVPKFSIEKDDVEGFINELQSFHGKFKDCFYRKETQENAFHYMVGQFSGIEKKNIDKETETETEIETQKLIIAGVGHKSEKNIKKRVQITRSISDITSKIAMFVMEGSSTKNIEGVPIMRLKELSKFETPNELKRTIKKRKGSSS